MELSILATFQRAVVQQRSYALAREGVLLSIVEDSQYLVLEELENASSPINRSMIRRSAVKRHELNKPSDIYRKE